MPDAPLLLRSGKVRDIYCWKNEIWLVATDRISAYDVILPNPIPGKGILLTSISRFWFESLPDAHPHHVLGFDVPPDVPSPEKYAGRLTRCLSAKPLTVECVVRGYLAGSAWEEYKQKESAWGRPLPKGLEESEKLPQPIFTPTTKAEAGHDLPMTDAEAEKELGSTLFQKVHERSLALYEAARTHAAKVGIILADTKFEFGLDSQNKLLLIDELLTPDSSRFWPADQYQPGGSPPSFDKQFVRDYLSGLKGWNRQPPGPALPPNVIQGTLDRYREACRLLTGSDPSLPES
jgi:phosphoribosylaminoimidazole-succinocarboxamide synthase